MTLEDRRPAGPLMLWSERMLRSSKMRLVALLVLTALGCEELVTTIGRFEPPPAGSGGAGGEGTGATRGGTNDAGASSMGGIGGAIEVPLFGLDFEAEAGALLGEMSIGSSDLAQGGAFILSGAGSDPLDQPGNARALYRFTVSEANDYEIWGRIHSPGVSSNRFWLRVDEGPWYLWRISTGEEWHWDDVHDNFEYGTALVFTLDVGEHALEIAGAVVGAELDSFSIRPSTEPGPDNTVLCRPPHSVMMDGQCVNSCGSYGNVSCAMDVCAGRPELVSYDCALCCSLD